MISRLAVFLSQDPELLMCGSGLADGIWTCQCEDPDL